MSRLASLRPVAPAGLLLISSLLPACFVTTDQGNAMEADIVKLKADFQAAKKDADEESAKAERDREKMRAEQDTEIKKIDAKIQEVNDALDGLRRTSGKTGADLSVQLDTLDKEVARLRGLVEEYQAKNGALEQTVTQMQAAAADLAKKIQEDEAQLKAAQTAAQTAATAAKKEADELPSGKDDFYKLAKKKYDDGDYAAARDLFTTFISKWKSDPLAASAQFWVAECWFHDKDFRKAGLEFQKVCDTYPKSEKAPDAALMVGNSFLELNLPDDAETFFQNVVDTYPKSGAAKSAEKKLAELKKHKK
jgi:tol-pal system protein YbgF